MLLLYPRELEFVIYYRKWSFSVACQQHTLVGTKPLVLRSLDNSPLRLHSRWRCQAVTDVNSSIVSCLWRNSADALNNTWEHKPPPQGMCFVCLCRAQRSICCHYQQHKHLLRDFPLLLIILHLLAILRSNKPFSRCSFLSYRTARLLHSILGLSVRDAAKGGRQILSAVALK